MDIFILAGSGYNGSAFVVPNPATIHMRADDNWSTSDTGTNISFYTTQDGTTSPVQRLFVANNGQVEIGSGTPSYLLDVEGGQVNASGGYVAAGTAGVSCAAGTVNLTTLTVTDGIVTHC